MDDNYNVAAQALSAGPKKTRAPRKKVTEIHAKKVQGGFHVTTLHAHPSHPPVESVHPDLKAVESHMEQHWGTPNEGEADMMEAQPGAPEIG